MILITNYHQSESVVRNKEYTDCLGCNLDNEAITKVVLLCDSGYPHKHPKLTVLDSKKYNTFVDMFKICKEKYLGETCLITNADITPTIDSLNAIKDNIRENHFLCITRREKDGTLFRASEGDSQDAWAFTGGISIDTADFPLGILGCDNRLAWLAHSSGFEVSNPGHSLDFTHNHESGHRRQSVDHTKTIGGEHLLLPPTFIGGEQKYIHRYWI